MASRYMQEVTKDCIEKRMDTGLDLTSASREAAPRIAGPGEATDIAQVIGALSGVVEGIARHSLSQDVQDFFQTCKFLPLTKSCSFLVSFLRSYYQQP
ncbi:unnamed protein product [Toxocara canis]|uniref:Endophilin-B1 n=1 Tax=Toxocara canis TaxID=6265 RepID=A0A183U6R2_TOXCA|nr:unnamed protein product [Toxocara canis]